VLSAPVQVTLLSLSASLLACLPLPAFAILQLLLRA
jgi:hypothetical protein